MPRRTARPGVTPLVTLAVAVTALGVVGACSSDHPKAKAHQSSAPVSVPASGGTPASAPGSAAASGGSTRSGAASAGASLHAPTVAPMPSYAVKTVNQGSFNSPSKAVTCVLTATEVSCQVGARSWPQPSPQPAGCTGGQYAGRVTLGTSGMAKPECRGASIVGTGAETLAYGQAMRVGTFACYSSQANILCQNETSAHGFTIAAEAYASF